MGRSGKGVEETAGASANEIYQCQRASREAKVREAHPRTADLRLALSRAPQHEVAWKLGAEGERLVAESLERVGGSAHLLHDRRIPGRRANIDHIAVVATGVWVIDAKNVRGKVRVERSFRSPPKLVIAGRDRSKLIEGLNRQITVVTETLRRENLAVPIHGALCFPEADLPLFRELRCGEHRLLWRKQLVKHLRAAGPVPPEHAALVAQVLADALPSAT